MNIINDRQWVKQWIEKADTDLEAAKRLCSFSDILTDIVCFHCQQSVEKVLKGFLISKGQEVRKTHDLVLLLQNCLEWEPSLQRYIKECSELNSYAVEVRYPATDSCSVEESRIALESATKIVFNIKELLNIQ